MQKFQDVLDGKAKLETLTTEELPEYRKFAESAIVVEEGKVAGFREAKRAEEKRVQDAKDEADRLEASNKAKTPVTLSPEMKVFRDEQIEKAKLKLFSNVTLTEEEKTQVLEKFSKLDSGKMDADFIYKDLVSSVAATQPDRFLELHQDSETRKRNAVEETQRQTESGGVAPLTDEEKKKFTSEALELATYAGITPEQATRQIANGGKRIIG